MAVLQYSVALRNAQSDAIPTIVGSNAIIRIYSGTMPANVAASLAGNTLLAELACSATLAPAAASGALTLNSISNDTAADATGTATFFRLLTSGAVPHIQGDVTATGGGGSMTLATTSIVASAIVSVTSAVFTRGNA
jgi:hypothetical protein